MISSTHGRGTHQYDEQCECSRWRDMGTHNPGMDGPNRSRLGREAHCGISITMLQVVAAHSRQLMGWEYEIHEYVHNYALVYKDPSTNVSIPEKMPERCDGTASGRAQTGKSVPE